MKEIKKYYCKDCKPEINKGEYNTFGICDKCWDKAYPNKEIKKVYCKNCKYNNYKSQSRYLLNGYFIKGYCKGINKNNDCKLYKKKWWLLWIR